MAKRRVLLIHDIGNPDGTNYWAYARRTAALKKHAPDDFEVHTCQVKDIDWSLIARCDLVFHLDYSSVIGGFANRLRRDRPGVPLVTSYNRDSWCRLGRRGKRFVQYFENAHKAVDWLVINNRQMFDAKNRLAHTCNISNGVDLGIWTPLKSMAERAKRVIWCGSSSVLKGKGYADILKPLEIRLHKLGFETSFRPIDHIDNRVYDELRQLQWYNLASIVVCASDCEGTPNFVSEAAACGCAVVTTNVGNVLEWGRHRENCYMIERPRRDNDTGGLLEGEQKRILNDLVAGIQWAWVMREKLGQAVTETMRESWGYDSRAPYFYALFRRLIEGGRDSIKSFTFLEIKPEEI